MIQERQLVKRSGMMQKRRTKRSIIDLNTPVMGHFVSQKAITLMNLEIKSVAEVLKEKYKVVKKRVCVPGNIYNTRRWRRLSRKFRQENPICMAENCNFLADDVDHINPITEGGAMWSEKNFQALCKSCHAIKSAKDREKYE